MNSGGVMMRTLTRTPCYRHAKLSGYRLNLVPNISNFFFWHLFLNLLTSNEESEKIFNTGQKWSLIFLLLKDYFFRSIPVVSIVIQSYSHIYIYICYR